MTEVLRVSYNVFKQAAQITTVYYVPIVERSLDGYVLGTGNIDFVYVSKILDPTDVSDFIINLFPNAIAGELEDDVIALPTIQTFNNISRFDLTADGYFYVGSAPVSTLDSDNNWTIKRFVLDSDGNVISKNVTQQNAAVWDDRLGEQYF